MLICRSFCLRVSGAVAPSALVIQILPAYTSSDKIFALGQQALACKNLKDTGKPLKYSTIIINYY